MGATRPRSQEGRRRNSAKASCLSTGQLASHYVRYIIAGEVAGAWGYSGSRGATLANLAPLLEPPIIRNMKTASRFEQAQSAARLKVRERANGSRGAHESEPRSAQQMLSRPVFGIHGPHQAEGGWECGAPELRGARSAKTPSQQTTLWWLPRLSKVPAEHTSSSTSSTRRVPITIPVS